MLDDLVSLLACSNVVTKSRNVMSEVGNDFFKYVKRSDVVQMKLAFTNNVREHYFGECFVKHSSESDVLPARIV
jgi:hypothetical protein